MSRKAVVIGAGAAGLTAALALARRGWAVTVLEARSRVGGRIWSQHPNGWPAAIELGAEFVHGGNAALQALMRAGKLRAGPVPEKHWQFLNGDVVPRSDSWERIDAVIRRIGPRFRGSFAGWLARKGERLSREDRELAQGFVQGFQGAPLDRMSAHVLFEATKHEEEQMRLRGGYERLIEFLQRELSRRGVRVLTNCVAREVRWKRGEVVVRTTAGQKFPARAALVTVPLGVLKTNGRGEGGIRFVPKIAAKQRVWDVLESGHAVRLVLRLRADVWRRGVLPAELRRNSGRAFGFLHSAEHNFPVWWALAPSPMLVGWTGGPAAAAMKSWTPADVFAAGCRTLARLLNRSPREIQRAIVDWRTHNWAADPFTRGAYSFATAGREDAPQQLAKPVSGTLFFAGEATADPLELGTVHGAVASGERAAREIAHTRE